MLKQELTARMRRLQARLTEAGFDAYIVTAEEDIWYYTNITYQPEERPFFIIATPSGPPTLLAPKLEEDHVRKGVTDYNLAAYWEYPSPAGSNWFDELNGRLRGYSRVGVEDNVPAGVFARMEAAELVLSGLAAEQRKVKSPYELDKIRASAQVCDRAMGDIFRTIYRGASVLEPFTLSRAVQTKLIQSGEFDPLTTSLLTAVWNAPASAMPHSVPGLADRFGDGPNVAMTYYRINGYAAECERTFFLGPPSADDRDMFGHMERARAAALAQVRPGAPAAAADAAARAYFAQHGLTQYLLHRTGHGVGLRNHEGPYLAEGSDEVLAENMVVTVEPGLYIEGVGGYRHSDTFLVTGDGYEQLTGYPDGLADMTVLKTSVTARLKGALMRKMLRL